MTAADTGIFARHGLDVELLEPAGGPENVRLVADGGADLCLTSVLHYLRARAEHGALGARFIAMVTQRTPLAAFVVAGRPTAAGVVPERARDLGGARIAGSPDKSALARELVAHLREQGAEPGEFIDVPYSDGMSALARGEVDAIADFIDLLPRMRRRVPDTTVRGLRLADDGALSYGSGLVASDRLVTDAPGVAARAIGAIREAWDATRERPDAGIAAFRERYSDVDPMVVAECWRETERLIYADEPGALDPARLIATLERSAAIHALPMPEPSSTYALVGTGRYRGVAYRTATVPE